MLARRDETGRGLSEAQEIYDRIRSACCEEHGLGQRNMNGKWVPRNDPEALDDHASKITALVLWARDQQARRAG